VCAVGVWPGSRPTNTTRSRVFAWRDRGVTPGPGGARPSACGMGAWPRMAAAVRSGARRWISAATTGSRDGYATKGLNRFPPPSAGGIGASLERCRSVRSGHAQDSGVARSIATVAVSTGTLLAQAQRPGHVGQFNLMMVSPDLLTSCRRAPDVVGEQHGWTRSLMMRACTALPPIARPVSSWHSASV
jgi:hypothetical protein